MQPREKLLVGGLLGAFLAWMAIGWVQSLIFEPFQTRSESIAELRKSVDKKGDERLLLSRAQKSLKEFKSICLPPDAGKAKQATALNAQRQYVEWLLDLSQLCGFEAVKVTPATGGAAAKGNVYISVIGKVEAEAHYEQLVKFLDLFYRTKLLHRISKLHVSTKVFEGDPILKVYLEAEGLALVDTPSRRTLFPQAILTEPLSEDGTTMYVTELEGFPKEAGFRIQMKGEYLKVTEVDGKTWKVERAVERTRAEEYSEGTTIDLVQMNPKASDRTIEEFREMIASNMFVKPAPPSKVKVGPLAEKTFTKGRPNDFIIPVTGYDTLKGKPEFSIVGSAPAGLKIDKSGKISWRPGEDIVLGKYPVKFQIRHPSVLNGTMTETLTIRVRDNKPLKFVAEKPPKVFLNRPWTYLPELAPSETTATQFVWKLGDKPPKGMTINSKTGELKWTPGDDTEIGEVSIPLVLTDNDSPPQSSTANLKIEVQDDAAEFTRLTGIFALGDNKRIFLNNQSTDKRTELHEGDKFSIADLSGTIVRIGRKSVLITLGPYETQWDVGQSLREVQATIKDFAAQSY